MYLFCNIIFKIKFDDSFSGSKPDLLETISFGSEIRLLALEQELQELREQISTIVKNNKLAKCKTLIFCYTQRYLIRFKDLCLSCRCICHVSAQ